MGMRVDKTGGHVFSFRIEDLFRLVGAAVADLRDFTVFDRQIRFVGVAAGAVRDQAVFNDDIVHNLLLYLSNIIDPTGHSGAAQ